MNTINFKCTVIHSLRDRYDDNKYSLQDIMRFHTSVQIPILTPVPVITQSPPLEPAPFGMKFASYVDALPPAERSLLIAGI